MGCLYGKIIFCLRLLYPGLLAVVGALPRKEQQNCSFPCGQAPTLSFPKQILPPRLVPPFWLWWAGGSVSGCPHQHIASEPWRSSELSPLPRVALIYNTVSVRVSEMCLEGEERGSFPPRVLQCRWEMRSLGAPQGPPASAWPAARSCGSSLPFSFAHLPPCPSPPALSSFLGGFATP